MPAPARAPEPAAARDVVTDNDPSYADDVVAFTAMGTDRLKKYICSKSPEARAAMSLYALPAPPAHLPR